MGNKISSKEKKRTKIFEQIKKKYAIDVMKVLSINCNFERIKFEQKQNTKNVNKRKILEKESNKI